MTRYILLVFLLGAAGIPVTNLFQKQVSFVVDVAPNLEEKLPDGGLFTPSTQSLLRGHHTLDSCTAARVEIDSSWTMDVSLENADGSILDIKGLPYASLIPRLNYIPDDPPGEFDALNLRLAEYSRNGLSVPVGTGSCKFAHFETALTEAVPWTLLDDYKFQPNPMVRPLRIGVTNNCLFPGLWELSARGRTGEVFHAWFDMPLDVYIDRVARFNGVSEEFASAALDWSVEEAELDLGKLRHCVGEFPAAEFSIRRDLPIGYSTQDSRRKIQKGFVEVKGPDGWAAPKSLDELTSTLCRFPEFLPPGKYSLNEKKQFDLRFLSQPTVAKIRTVTPSTKYIGTKATGRDYTYLEFRLDFDEASIVLGNIPLELIVPQEDFPVWGFGVGVFPASDFAERRSLLIEQSPSPAYAYLCRKENGKLIGLNSHEFGLEQIFLRAHLDKDEVWWEVTLASFERIVDLAKFKIPVPEEIHQSGRKAAKSYVSPLYRTYRDDNIR